MQILRKISDLKRLPSVFAENRSQNLNPRREKTLRTLTTDKSEISVVIPAFNEEKSISDIVAKCKHFTDAVVVVDDGSSDDTFQLAKNAGAVVLRNRQNMGKSSALRKGFREALSFHSEIIVTLDGDGQHNPQEIPRLIEPLTLNKADMAVGSRYRKHSLLPPGRRETFMTISFVFESFTGYFLQDPLCGFRAMNRALLERMRSKSDGFGIETEQILLAKTLGARVINVRLRTFPRYKKTRYYVRRSEMLDILKVFVMYLSFFDTPLSSHIKNVFDDVLTKNNFEIGINQFYDRENVVIRGELYPNE